jgi:putative ABC transport system substrate-binding protein
MAFNRKSKIQNLKWVGIVAIVVTLTMGGGVAQAQQTRKVPRIGWLTLGYPARSEGFRQGLRELGYIEGKNIAIELRNAERNADRLPGLAAELVELKVILIVALEPPALRAAINATKTIPIVMRSTDDPVELGFVASLARPGGNVTGLTSISGELYGKRLELLIETVRGLSRVAVLWNPDFQTGQQNFREMEAAAKSLGLQLRSSEARSAADFDRAFRVVVKDRAQALITLRNPLIVNQRKRIADLAVKRR